MHFKDRTTAGHLLAKALYQYKNLKNGVVIGLPRGGVVTAFQVAKELHLPLDVVCPRKLRAPFNPEFAIGAVGDFDALYLNQELIQDLEVNDAYLNQEISLRKNEVHERASLFRKGRPTLNLEGKTVIIVDDGIATGSTMLVAINELKKRKADKIIVATPVSHPDCLRMMETKVDEIVCLFSTESFQAVGQFYDNFTQVEDQEVIQLLSSTTI